jgi:hypothetical protein
MNAMPPITGPAIQALDELPLLLPTELLFEPPEEGVPEPESDAYVADGMSLTVFVVFCK